MRATRKVEFVIVFMLALALALAIVWDMVPSDPIERCGAIAASAVVFASDWKRIVRAWRRA